MPTVAISLGDPSGIGAELIAKLFSQSGVTSQANIVLIGDQWLWDHGQEIAQTDIALKTIESLSDARQYSGSGEILFVPVHSISQQEVKVGFASAA